MRTFKRKNIRYTTKQCAVMVNEVKEKCTGTKEGEKTGLDMGLEVCYFIERER